MSRLSHAFAVGRAVAAARGGSPQLAVAAALSQKQSSTLPSALPAVVSRKRALLRPVGLHRGLHLACSAQGGAEAAARLPETPEAMVPPLSATAKAGARTTSPAKQFTHDRISAALNKRVVSVFQFYDMQAEEWLSLRGDMAKAGITVALVPNNITKKLMSERYAAMLPLFVSRNVVLSSDEYVIGKILAVPKKFPKLEFLGAKLDTSVLNKDEAKALADVTLDSVRAQLVATLSSPSAGLVRMLSSNQEAFVVALDRIGKSDDEP